MASTSSTLILGIAHLLFLCTHGFTTDLIPIDSPLSPFYNPSSTQHDRLQSAIQRSFNRIKHFKSKMEAPLTSAEGEYLMRVSLGTPPVELLGIADTGSDLTWTQCLPCTKCFKQTLPLFDPHRSSSYKNISCGSDSCNALPIQTCHGQSTCTYSYSYGDGSSTYGDLSSETFTIGSGQDSSLPNVVFGCGHTNGGTFGEISSTNGLIGLGGGELSLVSQLGSNGKKFSYCLTQEANSTSKISFGSDAVVSGSGVVTTPIITKSDEETYYYLTLEAVSVGSKRIAFVAERNSDDDDDDDEGNIIIDSGTTLTLVPSDFLNGLVSSLEEVIKLPKMDDPKEVFELCYRADNVRKGGDVGGLGLPNVTAHFKGADVVLQPLNLFALVADELLCLTVVEAPQLAIFGNLAQMNMLIGYDLDAHVVSFKPTDCTNQH